MRHFVLVASTVVAMTLAMSCGREASAPSTFDPATIQISPAVDTLAAMGVGYPHTATVFDGKGRVIPGAVPDWSSSDTSVATVNASGVVTARRNGSARIIAALGKATGSATVVVEIRGALRIIVSVTGGGVDPDGYDLVMESGWQHMSRDTLVVSRLLPGARQIGLGGLASHCLVRSNPLTAVVQSADTVDLVFQLRCAGRYAFIDGYTNSEELGYVDETGASRMLAGATVVGIPRWSPDGTRLLYARRVNGNTDLYLVRPDGTGSVRLTNDLEDDVAPAWSPDGSRIAFFKSGAAGGLLTMAADGSDVRLVAGGGSALHGTPTWSPNGDFIAVSRYTTGNLRISLFTPNGSAVRDLTAGYSDQEPVWSPDGKYLAFSRYVTTLTWKLMIVAADASSTREFARAEQGFFQPAWSPDGRRITYSKGVGLSPMVLIANTDGTDDRPISAQYWFGADPSWSADGAHILLTVPYNSVSGIGMVDPDGGGMQLVFTRHVARTPLVRPR